MATGFDAIIEEIVETVTRTFAGTNVRPTTLHLIVSLLLDISLTPATCDDFGVVSPRHYQALQAVVRTTEQVDLLQLGKELDYASGNGADLTQLVKKYAPQYGYLSFHTFWDELRT